MKKLFLSIILAIMFSNSFAQNDSFHDSIVNSIKKIREYNNNKVFVKSKVGGAYISIDLADSFTNYFERNGEVSSYFVEVNFQNFYKFIEDSLSKDDSLYFHIVTINNRLGLNCHSWNNDPRKSSNRFFTFYKSKVHNIGSSQLVNNKNIYITGMRKKLETITTNNNGGQTIYNYISRTKIKNYLDSCNKDGIEFIQIWFGKLMYKSQPLFNSLPQYQIDFLKNNQDRITTIIYGVKKGLGGTYVQVKHINEFNDPCPKECNTAYPF